MNKTITIMMIIGQVFLLLLFSSVSINASEKEAESQLLYIEGLELLLNEKEAESQLLYIEGLELLLNEKEAEAVEVFNRLAVEYPDTIYALKAEEFLQKLVEKRDTGGLLGFYTGNLVTGLYLTIGVPIVFDLGPAAAAGAGIAGVGGSLFTSYMLTRKRDITFGQQLFTDSVQLTTMVSYSILYNMTERLVNEGSDYQYRDRYFWLGSMAASIGSRTLGYRLARDVTLPNAKPASYLTVYSWSGIYLLMLLEGILSIENQNIKDPIYLTLPVISGLGAAHLWERLGWGASRVGLLSVGGAAGLLIGGFVNILLEELSPIGIANEIYVVNLMVFGLLGQGATIHITKNFPQDSHWRGSQKPSQSNIQRVGMKKEETVKNINRNAVITIFPSMTIIENKPAPGLFTTIHW